MSKQINVVWQGEREFIAHNESGGQVALNADNVGGRSLKPSEMLLAALGGCMGITVIGVLEKKRQKVSAFEIELIGENQENWPKSYTSIHMIYRVTGTDINPQAVERAVELAETRYCTVSSSIAPPVTRTIEITPA